MLISIMRPKGLERLNNLPTVMALMCAGSDLKASVLNHWAMLSPYKLHIAILPKHKFAHDIPLVKQSSPTFAFRLKFKFLVPADGAVPPSVSDPVFLPPTPRRPALK